MKHDYSVAHLTALSLEPVGIIEVAARQGYRHVGLRLNSTLPTDPIWPLLTDSDLVRRTKATLAATGLSVLDVEHARLGPDIEPESLLGVLQTGAELGARCVITHFSDGNRARVIDCCGRLCALARPLGLSMAVEFLPWTETANLSDAAAIVGAVNADNGSILVDTLHFHRSKSTLAELAALPRHWFRFVHIADAPPGIPTTTDGFTHTARRERLLPGEGVVDFAAILGALPPGLPLALEIPHEQRTAEWGAEAYVGRALRAAQAHLDT
jgi:sugar phosphate isomerase/epimerase